MRQELHQLINSLTPSEKKYFTKQNQRKNDKEDPLFLQLFKELNAQKKDYSKEELEEIFSNKNVSGNNFVKLHQNLFTNILETMRIYDEKNHLSTQLRNELSHVLFLIDKNYFKKQVNKKLDNVIEDSMLYDLPLVTLEAYAAKRELLNRNMIRVPLEELEKISKKEKRITETIIFKTQLQQMLDYLFQLRLQRLKIKKFDLENIITNSKHKLSQISFQSCTTFRLKEIYYRIEAVIAEIERNRQKASEKYKKIIELHQSKYESIKNNEKKKRFQNSEKLHYISSHNNILHTLGSNNPNEFELWLDKMKRIDTGNNLRHKAYLFFTTSLMKLNYYINNGKFDAAKIFVEQIEQDIEDLGVYRTPNGKIGILYNIAVLFFIIDETNNENKCDKWLSFLGDECADSDHLTFLSICKLIQLIRYYEGANYAFLFCHKKHIKNDNFLHSELKSFQRYVKKLETDKKDEPSIMLMNFVIDFFKTLHQKRHKKELKKCGPCRKKYMPIQCSDCQEINMEITFKEKHKELQTLLKGKSFTGKDEILIWLTSRATGLPMLEVTERGLYKKPVE